MRENKNQCEHSNMSDEDKATCFLNNAEEKAKQVTDGPHCGCLICRVAVHLSDNRKTLKLDEILDVAKKLRTLMEVRHNVDALRQASMVEVVSPDSDPRYVEDVYEDLAKFVEEKLQYPHHAKSIRILAKALHDLRVLSENLEQEETNFEGVLQDRAAAKDRDMREAQGRN